MRLFLTLLLLFVSVDLAQAATTRVVAKYNGEGIEVRWFPPLTERNNHQAQFRVERTDSSGRSLAINHKPIRPLTNLAEIRMTLGPFSPTYESIVLSSAREQNFSLENLNRALRSPSVGDVIAWFSVTYPEVAQVLGRRRVDKDVQPGASYTYRVYADLGDGSGERLLGSARASAKPSPISAPRAVSIRQVAPDRVEISWTRDRAREAQEAVVRYLVYRKRDGGSWVTLNAGLTSPTLSHFNTATEAEGIVIDRDVVMGSRYQYAVSAVDIAGKKSNRQSSSTLTMVDQVPPAPPVDVSSAMDMDGLSLSWSAAGLPSDMKSFEVLSLSREDPAGMKRKVNRVVATLPKETTIWTTGRPNPGLSEYAVRSVDTSGNRGPLSRVVTIHIERPRNLPSPSGLKAKRVGDGVELTWKPLRRTDVVGYVVERRPFARSSHAVTQLVTKPIAETSWLDRDAPIFGEAVAYRVMGVDPAGHRTPPTPWVPIDDVRPAAQALIERVVKSQDGVLIEWSASDALRVGRFSVEVSVDNRAFRQVAKGRTEPATTRLLDRTSYAPGSLLAYRVISEGVPGAANTTSRPWRIQIGPAPMGAQTPPTATCKSGSIELTWERATGAERVEIQRADGEQPFVTRGSTEKLNWTDLHAREGRSYAYRLVAVQGHRHSEQSAPIEVICEPASP